MNTHRAAVALSGGGARACRMVERSPPGGISKRTLTAVREKPSRRARACSHEGADAQREGDDAAQDQSMMGPAGRLRARAAPVLQECNGSLGLNSVLPQLNPTPTRILQDACT